MKSDIMTKRETESGGHGIKVRVSVFPKALLSFLKNGPSGPDPERSNTNKNRKQKQTSIYGAGGPISRLHLLAAFLTVLPIQQFKYNSYV